MTRLPLTFACWDYDRTRALQDGRVQPEGVDLNYLPLPVEETFYRQARYQEFDLSELSLSTYLMTLDQPDPPFVALPVFPSRSFRHQSIYINRNSGITHPSDLTGKRVGTPEYQITAGVWIRGILADEYNVPPESVHYYTGGMEQPGRHEKIPLTPPPHTTITPIQNHQTLSTMLANGELDALYSPQPPSCHHTTPHNPTPHITRLFPDFVTTEQDYHHRTGIFPIMHTIVLRRTLHQKHPWLAHSLTKAFHQSLQIAYNDLHHRNALKIMLPWLEAHLTDTLHTLGPHYWDYGLEHNRHTLETFSRYHHTQGLTTHPRTAEHITLPTDDTYRI